MEQPTAMTMNFSNRYSYANGKEGWTKHVKSMQLETASFAPTFAQEILSGIIYGEGINTPVHQTLEEVERLNPSATREQAQAILICSTKIIEAKLAKLPAAKVSAHVALINGMKTDALEKLNQDPVFRKNSEQRRPDPMITWEAMRRVFYEERGGKGKLAKVLSLNQEKVNFLSITQFQNETVTDYNMRRHRMRMVVESQGIKVIPSLFGNEEEETIAFIFLPTVYGEWHTALKRSENSEGRMTNARLPVTISEAIEEAEKWKKTTTDPMSDKKPVGVFITDSAMPALVFGKPPLPKPQSYGAFDQATWKAATPQERRAVMDHNNALRAEVNKIPPKKNGKESITNKAKDSHTARHKENGKTMITTQAPTQATEETYSYAILTYMVPMEGSRKVHKCMA